MRFKLFWRYLDAMLRALCIAIIVLSFANITMETIVSADKSAVYNKYRNTTRAFLYGTSDWISRISVIIYRNRGISLWDSWLGDAWFRGSMLFDKKYSLRYLSNIAWNFSGKCCWILNKKPSCHILSKAYQEMSKKCCRVIFLRLKS